MELDSVGDQAVFSFCTGDQAQSHRYLDLAPKLITVQRQKPEWPFQSREH